MWSHRQLKKFFTPMLIAIVALTIVAAPARVKDDGQSERPAVVVPRDAILLAQGLGHPLLLGASNAEGIALSHLRTKRHDTRVKTPGNLLSFAPVVTYSSGGGGEGSATRSIAVADLNGDGKPDIVVANPGNNTLGVLLGNGDGTFQAAMTFNPGFKNPSAIAIADVNGDSQPDLVVGVYLGGVAVLLGNGDGTFRPAVKYGSGGLQVTDVAVADLNHDGKLDLVVTNFGSVLGVLLGNGDGTFRKVVTYGGGGTSPWSVAVADVNGDSNPDLLVADYTMNTVAVVLGNGDGTFQTAVTYSSGGQNAYFIAVADLNGDSKPDLAVTNCGTDLCSGEGSVAILLGNGDGTFPPPVAYDSGGDFASGLAIADVDGNGKPDLLVANTYANTVGALLGNGDGTFQPVVTYSSGGQFPISIVAADVNGDGRPDIVVRDECDPSGCGPSIGLVGVLLNNTIEGKFPTSTSLASSLNPSAYGQAVTWTAQVISSGSIIPTGRVRFTWSGNTIGSATLNSSGVATLTKSNLNADAFPLTAVYVGDANNLGSTSAVLNQVVLQTTSTASLTSSPNPSMQGQAVTFTATISSPTVLPRGPVTFSAGNTVLGTAQLVGGKAKLTISSLSAGSTKVTSTYNGDSDIAKSSASIIQTVQ